MRRNKAEKLSATEWKIMNIIWKKKTCATRDVHAAALKTQGWSRSTVTTLLRRLVAKGYLKTTQVGNSFLYRPARSAIKSYLEAADTLLDNTLEGMTAPILVHMVKNGNLSEEEIQSLQDLLREHSAKKESGK